MLNEFYWIFKKAIDPKFCDYVIESADWKQTKIAEVGNDGINEAQRITQIVWQNTDLPIGCVAKNYMCKANALANWNYSLFDFQDVQIGKYKNSGHYDWHYDAFPPENGMQRKLSCSILLNDEFEGGKFEIETFEKKQIDLQKGDIFVFPSFLKHCVTPVTSGTRYSAVVWATGPAFK
jgi:PKHD-type hydroxylase